ncbi:MAG TPA: pyridoxal-dependent decarboxylase [Acidimicrobiales bacterium]
MGHPMFSYDPGLGEAIFEYCRSRLSIDPVPLDYGGIGEDPSAPIEGLLCEQGNDPGKVLEIFATHLAAAVISIDSPRFLAFIPNAPTKASLLFDMVVSCSSLNGTSFLESAGAVVAENQLLAFLAERAGMPATSGGTFVSGGSLGNLSALAVARDDGRRNHPEADPRHLRAAISEEAHSSVGSALHLLGMDPLLVASTDHVMTADALRAALDADDDPSSVVAVVATAGTTNAGIVDELEGLGQVSRERGIWYHVDAAYGGAAMLGRARRELFMGLRHADSFIVDPHKWLFAPLDCCALIYREPRLARATHTQHASYLDVLHVQEDDGEVEKNPSDYAVHLSRRARGLPMWFSLAVHGTDLYADAIDRAITTADEAAALIESQDHVELCRQPTLSIVLFRRTGWGPDDYHAWSMRLLAEQVAFVTPTKWEGETVARFAFLHPDTSIGIVREVLDSMR